MIYFIYYIKPITITVIVVRSFYNVIMIIKSSISLNIYLNKDSVYSKYLLYRELDSEFPIYLRKVYLLISPLFLSGLLVNPWTVL